MVGVESVAEAQGVGENAHPDPEPLVVAGDDEGDEDAEAYDVEQEDRPEHPPGPAPLLRIEGVLELLQAPYRGGRFSHDHRRASIRLERSNVPRSWHSCDQDATKC